LIFYNFVGLFLIAAAKLHIFSETHDIMEEKNQLFSSF